MDSASPTAQPSPSDSVPREKAGLHLSPWAIAALALAHFVTVALLVGSVIIALQVSRDLTVSDDDVLVHRKDNLPLRVQEHLNFLNLTELHKLSILTFQKPTSLIFKINAVDTEIYRLYSVRAVEFNGAMGNSTLKLFLALDHLLTITETDATLTDASNNIIQWYSFENLITSPAQQIPKDQMPNQDLSQLRQLGGMGKKGGGAGYQQVVFPAMYTPVVYPVVMGPMAYAPAMTCINCGLYYSGIQPVAGMY